MLGAAVSWAPVGVSLKAGTIFYSLLYFQVSVAGWMASFIAQVG